MDQEKKKKIIQIVALVVLLAALGGTTVVMITKINSPVKKSSPQVTTTSSAKPVAESTAVSTTDTPQVPAEGKPAGSEDGQQALSGAEIAMNPNLFKVYQLAPPRNPFGLKEDWYIDDFTRLPGYPELRESGYFDSMDASFPDTAAIFGDVDFDEASLIRQELLRTHSIESMSTDGSIDTKLTYTEPASQIQLSWSADSGISGSEVTAGGGMIPDATDFFQDPMFPLDRPGEGGFPPVGMVAGDSLACTGINVHGRNPSALVTLDGQPYIIKEGSTMPPHYEVGQINEDGVVMIDIRDGSTVWVPLGGSTTASVTQANLPLSSCGVGSSTSN